jgi:hypothetical protein
MIEERLATKDQTERANQETQAIVLFGFTSRIFLRIILLFFDSGFSIVGDMPREFIQRGLFAQLPIPTQGQVHDVLSPHYELFWNCIMEPWHEFLEYRATDRNFSDLSEDEAAQWLTIQATHRARQFFDGKEGFRLLTLHRKLVIVFQEQLAITIKKLSKRRKRAGSLEELERSNYLTRRNRRFWNEQIDNGFPDVPRIILGYQRVFWAYRMPSPALSAPQIFSPAASDQEQPERGYVIAPIPPAEREGEDQNTGSGNPE